MKGREKKTDRQWTSGPKERPYDQFLGFPLPHLSQTCNWHLEMPPTGADQKSPNKTLLFLVNGSGKGQSKKTKTFRQ